jgi:hypothetical protein
MRAGDAINLDHENWKSSENREDLEHEWQISGAGQSRFVQLQNEHKPEPKRRRGRVRTASIEEEETIID